VKLTKKDENTEFRGISLGYNTIILTLLDLETLQIEDYPQDDHFDDVTENTEQGLNNASSVITLEESTIKNLQRLNENIDRITSSMSDFESIEKSINSLGQSIAIIVDCMSK
jgi:hypothetical protein